MEVSVKDIVLYVAIFASVYVQVFFLLVFLENKHQLKKDVSKESKNKPVHGAVTFLVPCWNEEKTIEGTVSSLKALSYPQDKIAIFLIDDGSTDGTLEVIQKYSNDPQIKVFTKENGGKDTALNYGLQFVESDFVASIDADTVLAPYAVEEILPYFEDPKVAAVGGNVLIKTPKTFAQKAQSIEYQMFSFNKKMLAMLGGVMVAPGAYSVYKTAALRAVGGWQAGHNLEDLELTYRLQTQGYRVEHANTAAAATSGPRTVRGLFKQRLRWGYGFLNNTYDYRYAMFNKEYGHFGYFTLPMSLLAYLVVSVVFFISWYNIILYLYDKFLIWKLAGASALWKFSFDSFYLNTKAVAVLTLLTFFFLLMNIYLGRLISNVKERKVTHFFYFFFLYSLIVPFWVLRSVWNAVFKARPNWR